MEKQHNKKKPKRKLHRKNLILLIEKENLIDNINLTSPPDLNPKNTTFFLFRQNQTQTITFIGFNLSY